MALTLKQMDHPNYWTHEANAQDAFTKLLSRAGMTRDDVQDKHTTQAGRLIDDMVAFLLRVEKDK